MGTSVLLPGLGTVGSGAQTSWPLFGVLLSPWHLGTRLVLSGVLGLSVPGQFPSPSMQQE